MIALFKKEVNGFFSSLSGYVVVALFLASTGLLLWIIPGTEFNIPENNYATLDGLFILAPWLFLFLIPAVTMRMFAEENKTGTIELLMTRPISDFRIVLAKYMASLALAVLSIVPTLTYFATIYVFASPKGNIDIAGITGSYLGLVFLCSAFASIGNFCSAATNNQIVSFLFALVMCYFFYSGFDLMSGIGLPNSVSNILSQFGISSHYASMSRGVIDSRDVVYYICLTLFFLLLTRFTLEKRKW